VACWAFGTRGRTPGNLRLDGAAVINDRDGITRDFRDYETGDFQVENKPDKWRSRPVLLYIERAPSWQRRARADCSNR